MIPYRPALTGAALAAAVWGGMTLAQQSDVFSFIPDGGRTILEQWQDDGLPEDLAKAIRTEEATAETWRTRLDGTDLDQWDAATLAEYLEAYAPLDPEGDLPRDGRDMTLDLCQSCHIVTVVVTQDRSPEAWLGTMNSPSHIEIDVTETERQLLADYLTLNAGIPIDQIPPELRAGGASY
jgi:hypothetical protein